jgi:hypothetical protein
VAGDGSAVSQPCGARISGLPAHSFRRHATGSSRIAHLARLCSCPAPTTSGRHMAPGELSTRCQRRPGARRRMAAGPDDPRGGRCNKACAPSSAQRRGGYPLCGSRRSSRRVTDNGPSPSSLWSLPTRRGRTRDPGRFLHQAVARCSQLSSAQYESRRRSAARVRSRATARCCAVAVAIMRAKSWRWAASTAGRVGPRERPTRRGALPRSFRRTGAARTIGLAGGGAGLRTADATDAVIARAEPRRNGKHVTVAHGFAQRADRWVHAVCPPNSAPGRDTRTRRADIAGTSLADGLNTNTNRRCASQEPATRRRLLIRTRTIIAIRWVGSRFGARRIMGYRWNRN